MDRDKVFDELFEVEDTETERMSQVMQSRVRAITSEAQMQQLQDEVDAHMLSAVQQPLEKIWAEYARKHRGQLLTKDELGDLVRNFITASDRRAKEQSSSNPMEGMLGGAEGLPHPLLQMIAAFGQQMQSSLQNSVHRTMLQHSDLIAAEVWKRLSGGNDTGNSTGIDKPAFLEKFLPTIEEVVSKGLQQAAESGALEIDAPAVAVISLPIEMAGMMMGGLPQALMLEGPSGFGGGGASPFPSAGGSDFFPSGGAYYQQQQQYPYGSGGYGSQPQFPANSAYPSAASGYGAHRTTQQQQHPFAYQQSYQQQPYRPSGYGAPGTGYTTYGYM
eukprot:TRINITY_DN68609_c0_g1_i1.p1 TRINITY_DN68609_c0_g1~~TRINITY_DN68609_c0_g1_i1.p1  ORF type:complete len:331 (-),score=82.29 TRINITY_DN68609_c0_g1_i1:191-1183(-)